MNEFTAQFVLESRELVEQASSSLDALERAPADAEGLDALYRSFHTLKGGASIVEFAAMERAVHAVEDTLGPMRKDHSTFDRALIEVCFTCLDRITRWLDRIETTGELPEEDDEAANGSPRDVGVDDWLQELLSTNPQAAAEAKVAVRYVPHPDSFLQGVDPLALIDALPQLLIVDLKPVDEWPSLEAFDPFHCMLAITGLTASSYADVKSRLLSQAENCEIVDLLTESERRDASVPVLAKEILAAQMALLAGAADDMLIDAVGSAGRVAANVFRHCGRKELAERIERATEKSLLEQDSGQLKTAIADGLSVDAFASISTSVSASLPTGQVTEAIAPKSLASAEMPRTLRVGADRIDALVRLTGELTVVKNALGHAVKLAIAEDNSLASTLKGNYGALDQLTRELQRVALEMRVIPLRAVLQRFPPVVREMAGQLRKSARLIIEGGDTEADKAIVEMLFEPLLHVVRNALDHGIEASHVRADRKKPAIATLRLRASRVREHVVIEVQDDGAGIDIARVRAVAAERGIASSDVVAVMTDEQAIDLVFAPGFSTAAMVTAISGRGVGMDAVRTAVGRAGGKVSIESALREGTTVRFTLPYSALMTHVMTVEANGQMFGIPLEAIVETISVPSDSIAGVGAARAVVRRNRTIPVFDLAGLLRIAERPRNQADVLLVIASLAGQLGGIEVDRLGERMEVLLKPLDGMLSGTPGVTGTAILGDGRVLLVLDLEGMLQ